MKNINEFMLKDATLAAGGQSQAFDLSSCVLYSVQIKLVATGANGVVKLQKSNDGQTWFDTGDSVNVANGTVTALWEKTDVSYRYARIDYTRTGVYNAEVIIFAKGV